MAMLLASASSQYLNADNASGLTALNGSAATWSIAAWFKTTQAGSAANGGGGAPTSPCILERRQNGSATERQFYLGIHTGGVLACAVCTEIDFTTGLVAGTTVVNTGSWFHGVATRNGTTSFKIYVNGLNEGSASTSLNTTLGYHLTIGCRTTDAGTRTTFFNGTVDDVRIYNRVLSDNEILHMYATRGRDGLNAGLLSRWLMREGATGATASGASAQKDFSDTKAHMTATASPVFADSILVGRRRAA